MLANKGFEIDDAENVIRNIIEIQQLKILSHLENLRGVHPDNSTMLPAFIIDKEELVNRLNIDFQIVDNILSAFCLPMDNRNEGFTALNDFNVTNACPLIPVDNDQYLLFQHYSLAEALYDSSFYWMNDDKKYLSKASENGGNFVEKFSVEKFRNVFGYQKVFSNIDIYDPKRPNAGERGEIDVLVVFGDKAIVLQAKSKRLTINAKKGNDNVLKSDFQAAIQESYNQGLLCAKLLNDPNYALVDSDSNKINITRNFKEIYIFCLISDHYPALSFQAKQFLHWEQTENIKPPFILDIFCLDVITEMLQSPLYLLSYVNRRVNYIDRILAHHEITILSFFMKHNPWLEDDQFLSLDDSVSSDIDSAMAVRRLGIPGKAKPDGTLTRLASSKLGEILRMIDKSEESVTIDLGFLLLTLGQDSIEKIEASLEKILLKSRSEHYSSDLKVSIGKKETGLTIHSNSRSIKEAMVLLRGHCEMRKYIERAKSWYGICVHPDNGGLRFVIKGEYPWVHSSEIDRLIEQNQKRLKIAVEGKSHRKSKIGVNERCPCESGLKYKKCCK